MALKAFFARLSAFVKIRHLRISDEFAEVISLMGMAVFLGSMFVLMLFVLSEGSAPAIILYLVIFGIVLVFVGFFIRIVNK